MTRLVHLLFFTISFFPFADPGRAAEFESSLRFDAAAVDANFRMYSSGSKYDEQFSLSEDAVAYEFSHRNGLQKVSILLRTDGSSTDLEARCETVESGKVATAYATVRLRGANYTYQIKSTATDPLGTKNEEQDAGEGVVDGFLQVRVGGASIKSAVKEGEGWLLQFMCEEGSAVFETEISRLTNHWRIEIDRKVGE